MKTMGKLGTCTWLLMSLNGCGAPSGAEQAADEATPSAVDDVQQSLFGTPVLVDEWSGLVRMGAGSSGDFQTKCTGTLWTNNTVLTSSSCWQIGVSAVKAGSQFATVTKHADAGGITMVRLSTPFKVWNSAGSIATTSGYVRPVYTGTPAALDERGTVVYAITIGSGNTGVIKAVGEFDAKLDDSPNGDVWPIDTQVGKVLLQHADLGAPCFRSAGGANLASRELDAISIGCVSGDSFCAANSAATWYPILALTLLSGW